MLRYRKGLLVVIFLAFGMFAVCGISGQESNPAVSTLDCTTCHTSTHTAWIADVHAKTQDDVASELAEERTAQTPQEVIEGDEPEDCIACHGPTAVLANGGMTEANTLAYFFGTTDGKFTADTAAINTSEWPNVTCVACHKVPEDHPGSSPELAMFDSKTSKYVKTQSTSELCGQCHGDLRFADTDHLTYNAWAESKHSVTQDDVASELAEERTAQTPQEVVQGDDAENCVACHAPTAVLANGGMTEVNALAYFFGTTDGKFTADTAAINTSEWPDVTCVACHDPHTPKKPAYFNSSTGEYDSVTDTSKLCGQCHGNLRFADTDHKSYNIIQGTGGVGVADKITMPGATCTSCHMYSSDEEDSNSTMYHGHSFAVIVTEADGSKTASCTQCHADLDADQSALDITNYKNEFQTLLLDVQQAVSDAEDVAQAGDARLAEAKSNLEYAESDESGGVHNHKYLMDLLNDALTRAKEIIAKP